MSSCGIVSSAVRSKLLETSARMGTENSLRSKISLTHASVTVVKQMEHEPAA
jgi:hypothetical protein